MSRADRNEVGDDGEQLVRRRQRLLGVIHASPYKLRLDADIMARFDAWWDRRAGSRALTAEEKDTVRQCRIRFGLYDPTLPSQISFIAELKERREEQRLLSYWTDFFSHFQVGVS